MGRFPPRAISFPWAQHWRPTIYPTCGGRFIARRYSRTVLQAWHEVDDAMDGYSAEQQRTVQLHVAVDESETALGAARRQYQAGVVDMLDVLTTQRIALDNQAALANSQATAAIARVELYRALGGGW